MGHIYVCFYCFDKILSVGWDCLVDSIEDNLGSLTLMSHFSFGFTKLGEPSRVGAQIYRV